MNMGNHIKVYDKEGNVIGQTDYGISSLMYIQTVGSQYDPNFASRVFSAMSGEGDINAILDETFKDAEPHDNLVSLIFLNDSVVELTEEQIPHLERAIAEYPADFNNRSKRILESYLELVKLHKSITLRFGGDVTADYTVVPGRPDQN